MATNLNRRRRFAFSFIRVHWGTTRVLAEWFTDNFEIPERVSDDRTLLVGGIQICRRNATARQSLTVEGRNEPFLWGGGEGRADELMDLPGHFVLWNGRGGRGVSGTEGDGNS